jgi:hypothetical protein
MGRRERYKTSNAADEICDERRRIPLAREAIIVAMNDRPTPCTDHSPPVLRTLRPPRVRDAHARRAFGAARVRALLGARRP